MAQTTSVAAVTAIHQTYIMPATTMPEVGVKVTCDEGCNNQADGNYPVEQQAGDMQAVGIQKVDKYVVLDQVVNIDAITANYSANQCDAENNPNYNLVQLDHIVGVLNSVGIEVMMDLDSPRLATIKPKIMKCIAYALAVHFTTVKEMEEGNEDDDVIPPAIYAALVEALAKALHTANKSDLADVGGFRDDATTSDYPSYLAAMAAADPNPTFDKVNFHEYPSDWKHPLWQTVYAKIIATRQAINNAWPNRAYVPGTVYTTKAQRPIMEGLTEGGAQDDNLESNGVSPQAQAAYDTQEVRALENNTLGIDTDLLFHWEDEPAGPFGKGGWQTASTYETTTDGVTKVNKNAPMMKMWSKVTAESRAGATSSTS